MIYILCEKCRGVTEQAYLNMQRARFYHPSMDPKLMVFWDGPLHPYFKVPPGGYRKCQCGEETGVDK